MDKKQLSEHLNSGDAVIIVTDHKSAKAIGAANELIQLAQAVAASIQRDGTLDDEIPPKKLLWDLRAAAVMALAIAGLPEAEEEAKWIMANDPSLTPKN